MYPMIEGALKAYDSENLDIKRINADITDTSHLNTFLGAHRPAMVINKSATALIGVSNLINPGPSIGIEAYVIVGAERHAD